MLRLVKPSKKYLNSFLKVIDDYNKDKNIFGRGTIDPLIKAIKENNIDEYLKKLSDSEKEKNISESYVPETRLWFLDGDKFVGTFSIRHRLTPRLEQLGGHISVNIVPQYRGRYSSFVGIQMCLEKARQLGLKRVLLTCDVNNVASYRGIKGLLKIYGGKQILDCVVDGHGEHRVWINTKKANFFSRLLCLFK